MSNSVIEGMWDILDSRAAGETEFPAPYRGELHNDQVVSYMKYMVENDPEGAARRASGQPQYDQGRGQYDVVEVGNARIGVVYPDSLVITGDETLIEALDRDAASFELAAPAALRDCE